MIIAFAGDVFLGGDLHDKAPVQPVRSPTWEAADLRLCNLEHPVSDEAELIGMLSAPSRALDVLARIDPQAVGLANNHIGDMGGEGIADTRRHLAARGIHGFGAGQDVREATEPFKVSDDLYILAYCDHDKAHMARSRVAGPGQPGAAPLDEDRVVADLARLPHGARAILFLHWGRENVFLPPHDDIARARRLLAHERVALIIGCHGHRLLGVVRHRGKRAYMGIGNFLIPNFHLAPGFRIVPRPEGEDVPVTRSFGQVNTLVYFKWPAMARLSAIITFDTGTGRSRLTPVFQDDDRPVVREWRGLKAALVQGWLALLGLIYRLPRGLYLRLAGERG